MVLAKHGDALCLREAVVGILRLHIDRRLRKSVLILLLKSGLGVMRMVINW